MVKLNLPLRPWVPQWLGIVTMFVVMFPIIMLNGTYTGSMLEVSSTLGILSEDITMGYYAAAAGMAGGVSLFLRRNLIPSFLRFVRSPLQRRCCLPT